MCWTRMYTLYKSQKEAFKIFGSFLVLNLACHVKIFAFKNSMKTLYTNSQHNYNQERRNHYLSKNNSVLQKK